MTKSRAMRFSLVILILAFIASAAQAQIGAVVANWSVPSSSSSSSSGLHHSQALADVTNGLAFIGVTPCRIVDTRLPAGPYGGPSLPAASPRSFALVGGPCAGLPATVTAYSLNITVTNTLGPGFISLYPTGGSAPLVSTLNYVGGQTIANAAIVPSGTGSAITAVAGVSGTDLIIDINGYYIGGGFLAPLNPQIFVGWTGSYNAGGVLFGANTSASTSTSTAAVRGQITGTQNGPTGVWGEAVGSSGIHFGVRATNDSVTTDTAAVFARVGTASWEATVPIFNSIFGVRAISDGGVFNVGVIGEGTSTGVTGVRTNSSGANQTRGSLGYLGTVGVFSYNDTGASGTKNFIEPHPDDPGKQIVFTSLEGNEVGTYCRGRGRFVNGQAVINVPEDFRLVTEPDGLTVQVTPIGRPAQVSVVSMDLNQIAVASNRDQEFSFLINGIRHHYASRPTIQQNLFFVPAGPDDRMEGSYPEHVKATLVKLGIYNEDGSVNMSTAERMGWASVWRNNEAKRNSYINSRPVQEPHNN